MGSEEAKAQLKPLAILKSSNDFEDELKGCGFRAVWPNHITIEEVFENLSSSKSSTIGGRYQNFIAKELGQDLQTENLLFALQWIEKQPTQKFSRYPFGYLADDIMRTAWACLDEDSQILKYFSKIAFKRLKDYQPILDTDLIGEGKEFSQLLEKHSDKRLKLVEEIVSIFINEDEDITYFAHSDSVFISAQDFLWLIEKLKIASSKPFQQAWAKLIRATYRESNFDHVNTILEECQENVVLESEFSNRIHAIEIFSPEAERAREWQEKLANRKHQQLDPPPKERVLNALSRFESGEIDAWWHLCHELTLLPTSIRYSNLYNPDLTNLPGWKEASEETKANLIKAAKKYSVSGNPETEKWLGKKSYYYYSALAGYKALQLLLNTEPEFCDELTAQVWQKWTPIILAYPLPDAQHHRELCRRAYKHAPSEFRNVLGILMHEGNTVHRQIQIIRYVSSSKDANLTQILLSQLRDVNLTAESVKALLEELLQHGSQEAKKFAESLVTLMPFNSSEEVREKAVNAACALMLHTEDAGWPIVWPIIQQDPEFGQQVLESVSYLSKFEGRVEHRLNEDCLADLYIFLTKYYPDQKSEEQVSTEGGGMISSQDRLIRPRDSIKMWRNYILKRLQERGTKEAYDALEKIIYELPELKEELQWRLLETETLTRRTAWQPLTPEDFFKLIIGREPLNSDLSNQLETIDRRTKKMENEPKVDKSIYINNSNVRGVISTGDGDIENGDDSNTENKRIDWKFWLSAVFLPIILTIGGMAFSGIFNDKFPNFFSNQDSSLSTENIQEGTQGFTSNDKLEISSVKTIEDSTTEIRADGGQGIISVYWEVLLSNVGDSNLSITDYKVLQDGEDFPVAWYTHMDQGLYVFENGEPIIFDVPIDISAGSTKKIYVRLGLMMTPEVSQLVRDNFEDASSSETTLKTIWRFLFTQGTDFYGNKIETQIVDDSGKIMARFPSHDEVREQEFVITFTTSRDESITERLSWYKFGGPYDLNRHL